MEVLTSSEQGASDPAARRSRDQLAAELASLERLMLETFLGS